MKVSVRIRGEYIQVPCKHGKILFFSKYEYLLIKNNAKNVLKNMDNLFFQFIIN